MTILIKLSDDIYLIYLYAYYDYNSLYYCGVLQLHN